MTYNDDFSDTVVMTLLIFFLFIVAIAFDIQDRKIKKLKVKTEKNLKWVKNDKEIMNK
jgi:hypothetical protein